MCARTRFPIVAATANPDKLARIRRLVGPDADLLPLPPEGRIDEPSPGEALLGPGEPLIHIAVTKALSASRLVGAGLTVATDGGLVVLALGDRWQPSLTRRFAGPGATNHDRAVALLALAAHLTGADRRIMWREAVAVARGDRVLLTALAESRPGLLVPDLDEPVDDSQGFWVPRLWQPDPDPGRSPSTGDEHWSRLAMLVAPFLEGLVR